MLDQFRKRYLTLRHAYANPLDEQRAQGMLYIATLGLMIVSAFVLVIWLVSGLRLPFGVNNIFLLMSLPFCVLIYALVQRGHLRVVIYALLGFTLVAVAPTLLNGLTGSAGLIAAIPITLATLLLRRRESFAVLCLVALLTLQGAIGQTPSLFNSVEIATDYMLVIGLLLLIYLVTVFFSVNAQRIIAEVLSHLGEVYEVAQLGTQSSLAEAETQLITRAINLLRDELGYDLAQVYLADEAGEIHSRVASGLNLAQVNVDTNIPQNERMGIMRDVLRTGQSAAISSTSAAAARQHLLPGIGSAALVPIRADDHILGVLDVQRSAAVAFADRELATLDLMARQLGAALRQNRLLTEMRDDLKEQEQIIVGQRKRITEFLESERRNTTLTWSNYLKQRGQAFIGFDMQRGDEDPTPAMQTPPLLRSALTTGQIQTQINGAAEEVSVPILLNDEIIGAMTFRLPAKDGRIGPRQKELIQNVVQRLALAIENRRLLEQSQSQAFRERTANEIGSILLRNTEIETILELAAEQFNEALGAVQARIYIQPDPSEANTPAPAPEETP